MKTVTFFSYKGGVGRTLAATNFATYLAQLGLKSVIVDFDLDAPGVDSKFPDFVLPAGQRGLIDYILSFQNDGCDPGPVFGFSCEVNVSSSRRDARVTLIPAGDYMDPGYAAKLNALSWPTIFSSHRDGVAFFQLFLEKIKQELSPDVVVIDSRTGFSEIGGLCTQQLADETVILSSLARECIKMTRHLAGVIRESAIARELGKTIQTKIVVSRVPNPHGEVEKLKSECCEQFGVAENSLFFLFSSPALERQEFVAMLDSNKDESLVTSYIQLFQGLDIQVAQESIQKEIEQTEKGLLSCSPDEAEARIRELAALYPAPEVYRRAMRFFSLIRKPDDTAMFGVRLLDLLPRDSEAQTQLTKYILAEHMQGRYSSNSKIRKLSEILSIDRMIGVVDQVRIAGNLTPPETIRFAEFLESAKRFDRSYRIALEYLSSEDDGLNLRERATSIAASCAVRLGKLQEVSELVFSLPAEALNGALASIAIQLKSSSGEKGEAFDIAKSALSRHFDPQMLLVAAKLAVELGQSAEIDAILRTSEEFRDFIGFEPEFAWELEKLGILVPMPGESQPPKRRRLT